MKCDAVEIKCHDCGTIVGEKFYKVQFTEHKRTEMIARGRLIGPFILCDVCVSRPTKPVQILPEKHNAFR